jgi:ribosomal protein S12 methylthiotransferase
MDKKIKSVYLLSLGCSKNLVDAECMSELIRIDNHIIVNSPEMADVIIVNTCGFIESAKTEAIETILDMSDYKKPVGNADYLIVTGCLSQRYAADILNDLPEVDAVLGTADYGRITEIIDKLYTSDDRCLDLPEMPAVSSTCQLNASRPPDKNTLILRLLRAALIVAAIALFRNKRRFSI